MLVGPDSGRSQARKAVLGAVPLLEIACQLLMFVNVAELWSCRNVGYLGSVLRGEL